MPNSTNALDLLRSQHDDVETLFEGIEKSSNASTKAGLFEQLADQLAAHAAIEEKLFYPAMVAKSTRDILVESTEEHLSIKRLIADLLELDVEDEHFSAKLSVLKEQVEHHAREEEEKELFPKCEKLSSKDELEALGGEMLALFEALMEAHPRTEVPKETRTAAPL